MRSSTVEEQNRQSGTLRRNEDVVKGETPLKEIWDGILEDRMSGVPAQWLGSADEKMVGLEEKG